MTERVVEYRGANGHDSWCHLRMVEDADKPLLVVCSEMLDNPGGSVTNFAEVIEEAVFRPPTINDSEVDRVERKLAILPQDDSRTIDAVIALVTLDARYPLRIGLHVLARVIRYRLEAGRADPSQASRMFNQVFWVEHYPAGRGPLRKETYALVRQNPDGSLDWNHMPAEEIAEKTGYSLEDIVVEDAKLSRGSPT